MSGSQIVPDIISDFDYQGCTKFLLIQHREIKHSIFVAIPSFAKIFALSHKK